ncbi:helix-turn-helix transcriptional regulator [Neoroseomonas rubea]|uniref:helix-turn-helix transcriptional regulator n=1 Tax=Neoroseomonas rubea TaxID=2748666 RepID=UPI0018DF71E9|nr:hypothetical protein [Roseomonas rubea]
MIAPISKSTSAYAPEDPLLTFSEACAETRRAPSTLHRDRANKNFPEPDAWNGRRPLWRRSTLTAFIADTATRARQAAAASATHQK